MKTYFECKIQYEKTDEDGIAKKCTEAYLLDAISFTEAEARITEEMEPFISGEFTVSGLKRSSYQEVFPSTRSEDDRWWKGKLMFITVDEKSGKEKKKAWMCLVQGKDFKKASANLEAAMKGTMEDYEIASLQETAILDVFLFKK